MEENRFEREFTMSEKTMDIVYHEKGSLGEDLTEPSMKKLGTVRVTAVHYVMSPNGRMSFKIQTEEPYWLAKLAIQHQGIKLLYSVISQVLILVNSQEIHRGDVFDIYTFTDPTLAGEACYHYDNGEDCQLILYWDLANRTFTGGHQPLIDLKHKPATCPFCGSRLRYADDGVTYCSNAECSVFTYRDISRFVTLGLGLYGFNDLIDSMVRFGAIHAPHHLYDDDARMRMYQLMYNTSPAVTKKFQHFVEYVDRTKGQIKFSDYLLTLPFEHTFACVQVPPIFTGSRYICPASINSSYQSDPMRFVELIHGIQEIFMLSEDYSDFKDRVSASVRPYMSFPVFHDLTRIFADVDPDINSEIYKSNLQNLCSSGVFADAPY